VLAGAQTGTGKTASFTLPLLQLLAESETKPQKPRKVRALILAPTRELAAQVYDSVRAYGKHLPLFAEVIVGGVSINGQIRSLQRGCDIVVATPGRLLDHLLQRHVDLSHIEMLVLDEADRMLDMGFLPDIRRIIGHLPKKKQSLLFSATFPEEIKGLAKQLLHEPAEVSVAPHNKTADNIKELCYGIGKEYKRELLSYLIGSNNWKQRRAARRQIAGRADAGARTVQERPGVGAGRDRHRRARPRHRRLAACDQFRPAAGAGRLYSPDRPHRPRGRERRSDFAGLSGGSLPACPDRKAARPRIAEGCRHRL